MDKSPVDVFEKEKKSRIQSYGQNESFKEKSAVWLEESMKESYVYNFSWLGRPIIQNPIDIVAMQEIIWSIQPDLIIETGIAHGGSLIFSASMLELNSICGGAQGAEVLGIDIDIRLHNREIIEKHPMYKRISMIEGSSISSDVIKQVTAKAEGKKRILVCLDSNHTHEHVQQELKAYAPLVSIGSYCVVFDTIVEDLRSGFFSGRPWDKGNNPKTAVWEYLKTHAEFEIDHQLQNKLQITLVPDGYLKRVS